MNLRFFFGKLLWIALLAGFHSECRAQAADKSIPETYCITQEELILLEKINQYRMENSLPLLELSKSLSWVAHLHVRDLFLNQPHRENGCNMHSWSGEGNWSAFCFPKEQTKRKSVWDKPKELTHYVAPAHELIFWSNQETGFEEALAEWKSIPQSASLILNTGRYAKMKWKTAGVAIFKGYVSFWAGEALDAETSVRVCHSDSIIATRVVAGKPQVQRVDPVKMSSGKYYLIFGSYASLQQASEGQQKLVNDGFPQAQILEKDGKYRTSIGEFDTMEAAKTARKSLPVKYSKAWILKD